MKVERAPLRGTRSKYNSMNAGNTLNSRLEKLSGLLTMERQTRKVYLPECKDFVRKMNYPRVCRRLYFMRGKSNKKTDEIFAGGSGTCSPATA